jgi:NAD(P)-dependent dehydrogenase (short-subunit alcohol dehydrogenase family)
MRLDGFEDKVALVTGAAQGIGRQICLTLVEQGCTVVGADVSPIVVDGVRAVKLDVSDERAVDTEITRIERDIGAIDLLVLNAGVLSKASLEATTTDEWERQLRVNLTGPFLLSRRVVPGMARRGFGRVVLLGSSAGVTGAGAAPPPLPGYAASKAGAMALIKSIAGEYAASGVTANALAPTLIDTGMLGTLDADYRSAIPVGRYGTPAEVAALVVFLCSAHAGYITGEIVDINGGFLID